MTERDEITLFRDRAVITQRVEIVATHAGPLTATLRLAAGVAPSDVVITDRGELDAPALRLVGAVDDLPAQRPRPDPVPDTDVDDPTEPLARPPRTAPSEVALDVTAPRAGRFAISLGYVTDHLAWEAAYTMTTTSARDRAVVRGAIAVRNTTGVAFRARISVVDTDFGTWRDHSSGRFGDALAGTPAAFPPPVDPCDLGDVDLGNGETRVELLAGTAPRTLRSVLVYDPIGPGLDHTGAVPVADPSIGVALEKTG
ncbi:MAG TPA: hypothetical protein VFK02_01855, partial [Kofleriaceae bacterium]|nr:hypothetical protein [Kofleriaceae bacterium]